MNKQLIFDNMIENILGSVILEKVKTGELIADRDNIIIADGMNNYYLACIPQELENENGDYEKIHGNTRNSIAKEFILLYSLDYLKKLYDEKIEKHNKNIQLQEENKYKLEQLYKNIIELNKYNKDINEGIRWNYGNNKYYIEFTCKKNNFESDNIQIYNDDDFDNFDFRYNYKSEILTINQVVKKINDLIPVYRAYQQEQQTKEEEKKNKEFKNQQLKNKLYELFKSEKEIIFKNKKTFIGFKHGLRYAVGEGKTGKYYNCDYFQLINLITKKNIKQYCEIDADISTYRLTNKELENLPYKAIV